MIKSDFMLLKALKLSDKETQADTDRHFLSPHDSSTFLSGSEIRTISDMRNGFVRMAMDNQH